METTRERWWRRVALVAVAVLGGPATAMAQEADADVVGNLARFIRWSGVMTSVLVILGAWVLLKFLNRIVDRLGTRIAARRLLFHKIATVLQFVVYLVSGVVVILLSFRLDDRVLAVLGGTIAVSVGFAVKDLVASLVAAVIIMLDRPFQVGDRVTFGGEYGDITAIGLRSVRLQTLDDNTVTIPNNKFLNDMTSCGNFGALDMMVVVDFHIGLEQDVVRGREIVSQAAITSRYVYLQKPVVVLVSQVFKESYFAVRLRLKAYVLDTRHEKAFESDVTVRVLDAFRASGIGPPAVLHRSEDTAPAPSPRGEA